MNEQHIPLIAREDFTTLEVIFTAELAQDAIDSALNSNTRYTYLALRSEASALKPGDRILVPTLEGGHLLAKIAIVAEIHSEPDFDETAAFPYHWIIGPCPSLASHDANVAKDSEITDAFRAKKRAHAKAALRAELPPEILSLAGPAKPTAQAQAEGLAPEDLDLDTRI